MNPNEDLMLAQLERELRSLAPLPPDPSLLCRLERTLHDPILDRAPAPKAANKIVPFTRPQTSASSGHNQVAWKPWAAVAACAAVATTAVSWKHNQLKQLEQNSLILARGAKTNYVPRNAESQLQGFTTGGLTVDPRLGLMRQLRFEFNNEQQFEDPSTGSKLEIRYPSFQEVLVHEPVQ